MIRVTGLLSLTLLFRMLGIPEIEKYEGQREPSPPARLAVVLL
jgi:hypothetical protein